MFKNPFTAYLVGGFCGIFTQKSKGLDKNTPHLHGQER
jgi:hypothetical protein